MELLPLLPLLTLLLKNDSPASPLSPRGPRGETPCGHTYANGSAFTCSCRGSGKAQVPRIGRAQGWLGRV